MQAALSICTSVMLCLLVASGTFADDQAQAEEVFFVKPGAGTLSVESYVKKYKCKFTYTAQGGTHEEWHMSLQLLQNGNAIMCSVERPLSSSYLFFENFKLELTGPKVSITDVELLDSQRDRKVLGTEEYLKEKTSVSSAEKLFKNHVEKIAVYSPLSTRDDL